MSRRESEAEGGDDDWNSMGGYMAAKNRKLDQQLAQGRVKPTYQEIRELMAQHGGRTELFFSKGRVTHVIATQLTEAKLKEYNDSKDPRPVVRPEWIVDCISQNKILEVEPYIIATLRRKERRAIEGFVTRQSWSDRDKQVRELVLRGEERARKIAAAATPALQRSREVERATPNAIVLGPTGTNVLDEMGNEGRSDVRTAERLEISSENDEGGVVELGDGSDLRTAGEVQVTEESQSQADVPMRLGSTGIWEPILDNAQRTLSESSNISREPDDGSGRMAVNNLVEVDLGTGAFDSPRSFAMRREANHPIVNEIDGPNDVADLTVKNPTTHSIAEDVELVAVDNSTTEPQNLKSRNIDISNCVDEHERSGPSTSSRTREDENVRTSPRLSRNSEVSRGVISVTSSTTLLSANCSTVESRGILDISAALPSSSHGAEHSLDENSSGCVRPDTTKRILLGSLEVSATRSPRIRPSNGMEKARGQNEDGVDDNTETESDGMENAVGLMLPPSGSSVADRLQASVLIEGSKRIPASPNQTGESTHSVALSKIKEPVSDQLQPDTPDDSIARRTPDMLSPSSDRETMKPTAGLDRQEPRKAADKESREGDPGAVNFPTSSSGDGLQVGVEQDITATTSRTASISESLHESAAALPPKQDSPPALADPNLGSKSTAEAAAEKYPNLAHFKVNKWGGLAHEPPAEIREKSKPATASSHAAKLGGSRGESNGGGSSREDVTVGRNMDDAMLTMSRDNPKAFLDQYFGQSRLSFLGSWKRRVRKRALQLRRELDQQRDDGQHDGMVGVGARAAIGDGDFAPRTGGEADQYDGKHSQFSRTSSMSSHGADELNNRKKSHAAAFVRDSGTSYGNSRNTSNSSKRSNSKGAKIPLDRRCVLHVDMDCFFVSCLVRDRPDLQDKPVVVAHSSSRRVPLRSLHATTKRGSTESGKNYSLSSWPVMGFPNGAATTLLKRFQMRFPILALSFFPLCCCHSVGVPYGRSGTFMGIAVEACPHLVVVHYNFELYEKVSTQIHDLLVAFAHDRDGRYNPLSIDEAMLEVPIPAGSTLIDMGEEATKLREQIFTKTKCAASAGVSNSMLLARLATRKAKPDGTFVLLPEDAQSHIDPLSVRDLPGVGHRLNKKLKSKDIETCADLKKISKQQLQQWQGPNSGIRLWEFCRGVDTREVEDAGEVENVPKTVSIDVNWGIRILTETHMENLLLELCKHFETRLSDIECFAGRIQVEGLQRKADCPVEPPKFLGCGRTDRNARSAELSRATRSANAMKDAAWPLLRGFRIPPSDLRGLGLKATKLTKVDVENNSKQSRGLLAGWLTENNPKKGGIHPQEGDAHLQSTRGEVDAVNEVRDEDSNEEDSNPTELENGNMLQSSDTMGTAKRKQAEVNNNAINADVAPSSFSQVDESVWRELPPFIRETVEKEFRQRNQPDQSSGVRNPRGLYQDGNNHVAMDEDEDDDNDGGSMLRDTVDSFKRARYDESFNNYANLGKENGISAGDGGAGAGVAMPNGGLDPVEAYFFRANKLDSDIDPIDLGKLRARGAGDGAAGLGGLVSLSQIERSVWQDLPERMRNELADQLPASRYGIDEVIQQHMEKQWTKDGHNVENNEDLLHLEGPGVALSTVGEMVQDDIHISREPWRVFKELRKWSKCADLDPMPSEFLLIFSEYLEGLVATGRAEQAYSFCSFLQREAIVAEDQIRTLWDIANSWKRIAT